MLTENYIGRAQSNFYTNFILWINDKLKIAFLNKDCLKLILHSLETLRLIEKKNFLLSTSYPPKYNFCKNVLRMVFN